MTVFLVKGSTGEYDCWHSWLLKAFTSKELAQKLVDAANEHAASYYKVACPKGYKDSVDDIDFNALSVYESPFDSRADMDYTGTEYSIEEIELDDSN